MFSKYIIIISLIVQNRVTDYKDFDSLVIKQNDWPDIRKYWDTHSSQEKLGRGDGYVPVRIFSFHDHFKMKFNC